MTTITKTTPLDPVAALAQRARQELVYRDNPASEWPTLPPSPDGMAVHNVVIAGAGINGLAAAFLLMRERVAGIRVVDRSPAGYEGPWLTFARMQWLRTPKNLVGPDLGCVPLSFPEWYRAAHGEQAWVQLDKAPNGVWMDYLNWFRGAAGIPVENGVRLTRVRKGPLGLLLSFDGAPDAHARQLILATGVLGAGGPAVPPVIAALPRQLWAHSADPIDFSRLAGRDVIVIGAGASAFDNAACALEAGAAHVELLARRASIAQPEVKRAMHYTGFLRHYGELSDDARIRLLKILNTTSVPPPQQSVERCTAHGARFAMRLECPVASARADGGKAILGTAQGDIAAEYVIAATGFATRVTGRPELAELAPEVQLWSDRVPATAPDSRIGDLPYLGSGFEFQSKTPALAPVLSRIRDLGGSAIASLGPVCTGLSGIKFGATVVTEAVTRALFRETAADFVKAVEVYAGTAERVNDALIF